MADALLFGRTQSAVQTPFDNSTNGFTSTEVQSAIEEAKNTAPGFSNRYVTIAGYGGQGKDHYMEFFKGLDSNNNPFLIAEASMIVAFTFINNIAIPSGTMELYVNGVLKNSLILTSLTHIVTGLSIPLVSGDKISIHQAGGSTQNPMCMTSIKTV